LNKNLISFYLKYNENYTIIFCGIREWWYISNMVYLWKWTNYA